MKKVATVIFRLFLGAVILFPALPLQSQELMQMLQLKKGEYDVGVKPYSFTDPSRVYPSASVLSQTSRKVDGLLWLPLSGGALETVSSDYMTTYGQVARGFSTDRFKALQKRRGVNDALLDDILKAFSVEEIKGEELNLDYPMVIYYPGFGDSAFSNAVLCEYLASHGFLVVSVSHQGQAAYDLYPSSAGLRAAVQDVEFVTGKFRQESGDQFVALMGHSWGGFVSYLAASRNPLYQAVISLDGSTTSSDITRMKEGIVSDDDLKNISADVLAFVSGGYHHDYSVFSRKKYSSMILGKAWNMGHPFFTSHGIIFRDFAENTEAKSLKGFEMSSLARSYSSMSSTILDFLESVSNKEKRQGEFNEFLEVLEKDTTFSYAIKKGERPIPSKQAFEYMIQVPEMFDRAVAEFHRAVLADPGAVLFSEEIILAVADYYASVDDHDKAKMLYGMAVVSYPKSVNALYSQGAFFEKIGFEGPAKMYYKLALQQDPHHAPSLKKMDE